MSGTATSTKKSAATTKKKYGLTPDGKSIQHVLAGRKGGQSKKKGGKS